MTKPRPSVDQRVYDLAVTFLSDFVLTPHDTNATLASMERIDMEWDLAAEIQSAVEDWIGDAELHGRIKERDMALGDCVGCDGYVLSAEDAPYCPSCARERPKA